MRDALGLVPAHIKANYERREMVDSHMKAAIALCRAVKAIDERLDIEFISEGADPEYGVVPGRWHVVRKNPPPAPDSFIPITTRDGGYCEPHSGILEELRRRDLWKEGARERYEKKFTPQKRKPDEGMVEELAHDLRAGARVAGDGGLTRRRWGRG
jgi:hypothetical protein